MAADPWAEVADVLGDEVAWSQACDSLPYTRENRAPSELFTTEQWALFDSLDAHHSRMERKYGRLIPEAMAAVRAMAWRIR
jgi:hypothetical protein